MLLEQEYLVRMVNSTTNYSRSANNQQDSYSREIMEREKDNKRAAEDQVISGIQRDQETEMGDTKAEWRLTTNNLGEESMQPQKKKDYFISHGFGKTNVRETEGPLQSRPVINYYAPKQFAFHMEASGSTPGYSVGDITVITNAQIINKKLPEDQEAERKKLTWADKAKGLWNDGGKTPWQSIKAILSLTFTKQPEEGKKTNQGAEMGDFQSNEVQREGAMGGALKQVRDSGIMGDLSSTTADGAKGNGGTSSPPTAIATNNKGRVV